MLTPQLGLQGMRGPAPDHPLSLSTATSTPWPIHTERLEAPQVCNVLPSFCLCPVYAYTYTIYITNLLINIPQEWRGMDWREGALLTVLRLAPLRIQMLREEREKKQVPLGSIDEQTS